MSYCRWSTDDYQCDIYAYADVGGGVSVHVARGRYAFKEPLPPKVSLDDIPAFVAREKELHRILEKAPMETIDLPHAGESFFNLEQEDAANFIDKLAALGYRVPDYVSKAIRDDDLDE